MCGISGIWAKNNNGRKYLPGIERSVSAIAHRGPDFQAIYTHGNVALGHARLSVIDLSPEAHQPFKDQSGRYVIIYNGEIYNFRQLRHELESKGHSFRTQSDTEVLLSLWISEGPQALDKLNGFFAFAIYDSIENSLFLARDRFGIKPLLYFASEDVFIFSSEMKGLIAAGIPRVMDQVSLAMFFQLNYIPQPYSIFNNVTKIPPGHYGILKSKGFVLRQYYDIPSDTISSQSTSYDQAGKDIKRLLTQSVERRMVTDVPLGAFLSGGLDSSIITSLAARFKPDIETFTIGYRDEPWFDERKYAASVAAMYKTNHHEIILSSDDLYDVVFDVLDHIDEPFADSSALAVYILSREVRKNITVALSGDGADELFGGYIKHTAEWAVRKYGYVKPLAKVISPLLRLLPQSRQHKAGNRFRQLQRLAGGMELDTSERYWRWCSISGEGTVMQWLREGYSGPDYKARKAGLLKDLEGSADLNRILLTDLKMVLPSDMLTKVDLMSMSHALEVRLPFLDHELVSYVSRLPASFKIDGFKRKKILRDTFRDSLPPEVVTRSKQGFEVPLLKWFRGGLSRIIHEDLLEENFIREQGIFNPAGIVKLRSTLKSGNPGDIQAQIWALIVFQSWWKHYMQNQD